MLSFKILKHVPGVPNEKPTNHFLAMILHLQRFRPNAQVAIIMNRMVANAINMVSWFMPPVKRRRIQRSSAPKLFPLQDALQLFPEAPQTAVDNVQLNAAATVSSAQQPRGRRMPPILSEFLAVTTIHSHDMPPLDSKRCLTQPWMGVPQFAKLLQFSENGDVESRRFNCTFGIFRAPLSWITDSLKLDHPFDVFHAVPDLLVIALFNNLTWGAAKFKLSSTGRRYLGNGLGGLGHLSLVKSS